jgi:hypothetical protein
MTITVKAPTVEPTLILLRDVTIELQPGERYAGLLLADDGMPSHHLVLLPGTAEKINWTDACTWAAKAGGELPTRREQSLLFANLQSEFDPERYWSGEAYSTNGSYAWRQSFSYGDQGYGRKSYEGRARVVRRFAALESNHGAAS